MQVENTMTARDIGDLLSFSLSYLYLQAVFGLYNLLHHPAHPRTKHCLPIIEVWKVNAIYCSESKASLVSFPTDALLILRSESTSTNSAPTWIAASRLSLSKS